MQPLSSSRFVPFSEPAPLNRSGLHRRIAFRSFALYLVLYNIEWLVRLLPGFKWLGDLWEKLWLPICPWVGKHLLGISYAFTGTANGSGDKTFDYVQIVCFAALALLGGAIWSAFDRRRRHDATVHDVLWTSVRYVLACSMLSYGFAKVYHLQMPAPGAGRLMQPYGDSSPMGLIWTFMGYSAHYSFIAGAAEVMGGLLLFLRRTTTLGALLVFVLMTNVAIMNFCFDVPVKLYASHLVLMSVFIMSRDLHRLASVLLFNRPTAPTNLTPSWALNPDGLALKGFWRHRERLALALKLVAVCWIVGSELKENTDRWKRSQNKSDFAGSYRVERFQRNGVDQPLLLTDETLWRRIGIDDYGTIMRASVRFMNDTGKRFNLKIDAQKGEWSLTPVGVPNATATTLRFQKTSADQLRLEGTWDEHAIAVDLRRVDTSQTLLMSRGFRWINEAPFNR